MPLLRNIGLGHLWRLKKVNVKRTFSKTVADVQPEKFQRKHRSHVLKIIQDAGLRMRMAIVEDGPAILDFLREHFHKEEPLNAAMEVTTSGYGTECKTLDEFCIGQLHQNASVVCESADSSLEGFAAVMTCGIIDKAKDNLIREKIACAPPLEPLSPTAGPEERLLRIDRFVEIIIAEANIFGMYSQLDKLLESNLITVHPKYRKRGVCEALLVHTRDLAKLHGLHLVRSYCASPYTLAKCTALGWKCIHRIPYTKYLDSEGNPIIKAKAPNLDEVLNLVWEIDLK